MGNHISCERKSLPPVPAAVACGKTTTSGHRVGQQNGHKTLEVLEITRMLEQETPCCLIGSSALIFYGAPRIRGVCHSVSQLYDASDTSQDWQICVPTKNIRLASEMLQSAQYEEVPDSLPSVPGTLLHTFPRYRSLISDLHIILVPDADCHILCCAENIERSLNNLPYPKLSILVQSFVDTMELVGLQDIIDATNIGHEWAEDSLDLTGTNDVAWALNKNRLIKSSCVNMSMGVPAATCQRKDIWESALSGKQRRLGWKYPPELFTTRFRPVGSPDPWKVQSEAS